MTLKYCQTKAKDVLLRNQKTRHPKSSLARKKITGARSTTWVVLPLWSLLALYRCFRGQKVFTVCSTPNFLVLVILFPSKRFQHLNVLSTPFSNLVFLGHIFGTKFLKNCAFENPPTSTNDHIGKTLQMREHYIYKYFHKIKTFDKSAYSSQQWLRNIHSLTINY